MNDPDFYTRFIIERLRLSNQSVNGSLWTIGYEFFFYIFIAILGILKLFKFKWCNLCFFVGFLYLYIFKINIFKQSFIIFKIFDIFTLIELGLFFSTGMLIYAFRKKIILDKWLALLSLIILFLFFRQGVCVIPFAICGSYLLFYLGYNKGWNTSGFTRYGDFSYGIYIYAFPIQQMLIYLYKDRITAYTNFVLAFIITLVFAVLSWHFIEKPCLRLKNIKIWKRGIKDDPQIR